MMTMKEVDTKSMKTNRTTPAGCLHEHAVDLSRRRKANSSEPQKATERYTVEPVASRSGRLTIVAPVESYGASA